MSALKSPVEVLWTARYDYQPDWKLLKHDHEYFQLICFLSGSGQFALDHRDYPLSPGAVFLIKPNVRHGLTPTSLVKTLDVKFLVKDRGLLDSLASSVEMAIEKDMAIANLLEHIRREGEAGGVLYRQMCDALLVQILLHFLRLQNSPAPKPISLDTEGHFIADPVTQAAVDFVKQHYSEELGLGEIAKAVGKSDRYVRRRFEEFVGVSPMRYLLHYRIRKAQELILHSEHPLKEIADLVGFKTIHHFARAFHEVCGETPGSWRRRCHSGICKDVCINPEFSNTIWTVPSAGLKAS